MTWKEQNATVTTTNDATSYYSVGMQFTPTGLATRARVKVQNWNGALEWRVIDLQSGKWTTLLSGRETSSIGSGFIEVDISAAQLEPGITYLFAFRRASGAGTFFASYSGEGVSMRTLNTNWTTYTAHTYEFYLGIMEEAAGPQFQRLEGSVPTKATVKRFTNGQWVDVVKNVKFDGSVRRFYDTTPYPAKIDSVTTATELGTVASDMEIAYGVEFSFYTASTTRSGYSTDSPTLSDAMLRPAFKVSVEELAKYPPEFMKTVLPGPVKIIHAKNLSTTGGVKVRGVAFDSVPLEFWYDINSNGSTALVGTIFDDLRFTFHHELQHCFRNAFKDDFAVLESEWTALNSVGYVGSSWSDEPKVLLPGNGFFRSYSRASYSEDVADVWGVMMTTHMQEFFIQGVESDPILKKKAELLRSFMGKYDPAFRKWGYYEGLHK